MDNTNYIALSRQMALWKQMDIVSNNMANMNTSGYKQDDVLFSSFMVQTPDAQGIGRAPLYFTEDFGSFQDFSEGPIVETGPERPVFFGCRRKVGDKRRCSGAF